MKDNISVIVVGYGFRGKAYTEYCAEFPERMRVVGAVDPDPLHLGEAKEKFGLADDMCFSDFKEFVKRGKIADCVINATMDDLHVETALPLLELGYDMLLEKPVTAHADELMRVKRAAEKNGCRLIICHVLRYTPFYSTVKRLIEEGAIGRVRHIETSENVPIPHASSSYIRGKWNNSKKCGSSYMLAKCCHDADLLCWLNNKSEPEWVESVGTRRFYVPENAPEGAGTRCLLDCKCEESCPYSVRKFDVDHNPFGNYIWENYQGRDFTPEEREYNLKYENPHGRCAFKTDSDLVDQQVVTVAFADGSTAVHTLFSGASYGCRRIHVYGEKGEIAGNLDISDVRLLTYDPLSLGHKEEKIPIDMDAVNHGHAGGDYCIMEDLWRTLTGGERSISCTDIEDSVNGHLVVYAADLAMERKSAVEIKELKEAAE